jgi:hypothetical protein
MFFNNVFLHNIAATTITSSPQGPSCTRSYDFNNVAVDNQFNGNIWLISPNTGNSGAALAVFNNTIEAGADAGTPNSVCFQLAGTGMTLLLENNYCISSNAIYSNTMSGGSLTALTNAFQSKTATNAQAYTLSQNYAFSPISGCTPATCATDGNGTNAQNFCTNISGINSAAGSACLNDTTYACAYNMATHSPVCPARAVQKRPLTAAWDIGAYQSLPSPGTNLKAAGH